MNAPTVFALIMAVFLIVVLLEAFSNKK